MKKSILAMASLSALVLSAEPVKVIFDTDMVSDYDDVGALACLHAFADEGRCEILAMASCTRGNQSVAAVEVLNAFYGRPDIPVGCAKELGVVGVPGGDRCAWRRAGARRDAEDAEACGVDAHGGMSIKTFFSGSP